MKVPENVTTMKHIKRGTEYNLVAKGMLQTDKHLGDYTKLVAYQCKSTGDVWFRPEDEITDDRFQILADGVFLLPALLADTDKLQKAIHVLHRISKLEPKTSLPWTHEAAADEYWRIIDTIRTMSKQTLDEIDT